MPERPAQTLAQVRDHFRRFDRIRQFEQHQSKVHSVAWNCDGRRLASGSLDKKVNVSMLDNYRLKNEFIGSGHSDQVDQVCWHHTNPDILSSASGDKTVRVWDMRAKKSVHSIATKGQNINVSWAPDGSMLGYGDKDDRISIIDTKTWKSWDEIGIKSQEQYKIFGVDTVSTEQFKSETNEFAWERTSQFLFVASGQGRVFVYKTPDLKLSHTIQAHPAQSNCVSIKMDLNGDHFAVGGADAVVGLWQLKDIVCLRTIDRLDYAVRAVGFSHDGRLLAAGSEDHCIDISWVDTGERVIDLKQDAETYTLSWHPKHYILAFASGTASYRDGGGNVKLFGLSLDQI